MKPDWAMKALGFVIAVLLAACAWYIRDVSHRLATFEDELRQARVEQARVATAVEYLARENAGGDP